MIEADDFTFRYPTAEEPALSSVSFRIQDGAVLGVLGPVGAGKTTLAMAIASFAPQNTGGETSGQLTVAGRDPRTASDNAVAMVFEDYSAQFTQVRVIDEVVAPLVNRGLSRSEAVDRARDLLDRVRIADCEEKFTWDLSGGQQQRLAIAAALAIDPEVMIFDTATDMLDPEGKEDVTNLMATLAGNTTLVITSNDPDDLAGIADEVVVLDDGSVVAEGPAGECLRNRRVLEAAGLGRPTAVEISDRLGLEATPLTREELAETLGSVGRGPTSNERRSAATTESAGATVGVGDDREQSAVGSGVEPIAVSNARYEYADGTVAVDGATLDVTDGEVHAVIGANGAGKSTFSRLLVGLLDPDDGHVHVSGTETTDSTARELGTDIGIALQNPSKQLSERTVEAELRFPLERRQFERTGRLSLSKRRRYDDEFIQRRVETARQLVGLEEAVLERDPMFLSRGLQRLVTIAVAVAPDPDAVVLDEPTAGLDAETSQRVVDAIEALRSEGTAILVIDHDMDFVAATADRVSVLSNGAVVGQGPPAAIFDPDRWEWLAEHHLRPPRVARLANDVGVAALTVDEFVEAAPAPEREAREVQ